MKATRMTSDTGVRHALAVFAAACLLPGLALATPPAAPPGGGRGPEAQHFGRGRGPHGLRQPGPRFAKEREQAMRAVMLEMLRDDIGLPAAKVKAVGAHLDAFAPRRRKLRHSIHRHGKALRLLVRAESGDEVAFKRAIDGMLAAQRAERALRDEMFRELRKHMTPKQQAKLLMALPQVHGRVRAKLARGHKERMRAEAMRLLNDPE